VSKALEQIVKHPETSSIISGVIGAGLAYGLGSDPDSIWHYIGPAYAAMAGYTTCKLTASFAKRSFDDSTFFEQELSPVVGSDTSFDYTLPLVLLAHATLLATPHYLPAATIATGLAYATKSARGSAENKSTSIAANILAMGATVGLASLHEGTLRIVATAIYPLAYVTSYMATSFCWSPKSTGRALIDGLRGTLPEVEQVNAAIDSLSSNQYDDLATICSKLRSEDRHPITQLALDIQVEFHTRELAIKKFIHPRNPQYDLTQWALHKLQTGTGGPYLERAYTESQTTNHPLRHEIAVIYGQQTGNWKGACTSIIGDSRLDWESAATSANAIERIKTRKFLRDHYIVKHVRKNLDESIYDQIRQLGTIDPERFQVPTFLYAKEGFEVMRFLQGRELTNEPLHTYLDCAEFLSIIHEELPIIGPERDYQTVLTGRIHDPIFQGYGTSLEHDLNYFWNKIEGTPRWDQDPWQGNWLLVEQETKNTLVALDFEQKSPMNLAIQLAKFTESSPSFGSNLLWRKLVAQRYCDRSGDTSDQLYHSMLAASPIVATNSFYFSQQGRVPHQVTLTYLNNALRVLHEMASTTEWNKEVCDRLTKTLYGLREISSQSLNQEHHKYDLPSQTNEALQ
jgi:hypothetical protein